MKDDLTDIKEEYLDLEIDIEENITNDSDNIENAQKNILAQLEKENLVNEEIKSIVLDPKNDLFLATVKDNINYCVNELKDIETTMQQISNQRNSEMFFKKSENIRLISQYMSKIATVNQKTLDLLILLLGAGSKISEEYHTILITIDELGSLNNGEAEVLSYLLKVKKMVSEIQQNDMKMQFLVKDNTDTKEILTKTQEQLVKITTDNEKSKKLLESKFVNVQRKINFNNIYIGFCLLLIIALAIFIGVKLYVF